VLEFLFSTTTKQPDQERTFSMMTEDGTTYCLVRVTEDASGSDNQKSVKQWWSDK